MERKGPNGQTQKEKAMAEKTKFMMGDRAVGKTYTMIRLAVNNNAVLVVPTRKHIRYIKSICDEHGLKEPNMMSARDFADVRGSIHKYVFDDVLECLRSMQRTDGIVAVSMNSSELDLI